MKIHNLQQSKKIKSACTKIFKVAFKYIKKSWQQIISILKIVYMQVTYLLKIFVQSKEVLIKTCH